jgi:two-component system response regulator NreC
MRPDLRLLDTSNRANSMGHADQPLRILLADRHATMRRSLKLLLDLEQDLIVVAETADLFDIVGQLRIHRPQVLVLELSFPETAGLRMIRELTRRVPDVSIIATGLHEHPAFFRAAIDAGARGYVLKDQADTQLPAAIQKVRRCADALGAPYRPRARPVGQAANG